MTSQKQQNTLGFYVIFSEDPFLVADACEKLLDSILGPDEDRGLALYEPKADEANISDVLDELRTLPFLSSRRVVLVKDAESFVKANTEHLEKYVNDPSSSGVLILTVTSWDKRTRLHRKLQKTGGLVEIVKMKSGQMPAYVSTYAQQTYGVRLDRQCSRLLVELIGDDPGRLCREMDKLAIYVAPKKTVTFKDIEQLIGKNRMFGAFEVIDSINAGQIVPAMDRLRNMFAADKNSEYTVVGAFGYHFRRLFRVKTFLEKGDRPQQAVTKAGVFGYFQRDVLRQAQQLTLLQLGNIMAELGKIDFGLKTGRTTAPVAMERLILKIFSMQNNA